jgi:hypothetical protein
MLSAFVAAGLALSLLDAQPAPAGAVTTTNPNVTSTGNGTSTSRRNADKTTRAERDRAADESGVERVGFDRAPADRGRSDLLGRQSTEYRVQSTECRV